jgi:hypothetical protein
MSESPRNQLLREQGTEIAYKPFSPLALLAFLFGLLSFLTIASFAFIAVGIAGIIVGLVAMFGCKEGRVRSGYNFARAGVFFSALGLALGVGHYSGRIAWLCHVAKTHAAVLIANIENDLLEEAHSLSYPYYMRPAPGTDLIEYYKNPEAPKGHNNIPPVAAINFWMDMHPTGTICKDLLRGKHEYIGFQEYNTGRSLENIVLRYRYIPASPDIAPFVYDIDFKRNTLAPPIGIQWEGFFKAVFVQTGEKPVRSSVAVNTSPRRRFKNSGNEVDPTLRSSDDKPSEKVVPPGAQESPNK